MTQDSELEIISDKSENIKIENNNINNETLKDNELCKEKILKQDKIRQIKDIIEKLDTQEHIEILRIFKKYKKVIINENSNGIFINITDLDNNIIVELEEHLEYLKNQKNHINEVEKKKEIFINNFFSKNITTQNSENFSESNNDHNDI